jgi:FkbH-like protein
MTPNPEIHDRAGPSAQECAERRAWHSGYFYRSPRDLRRSHYTPIRALVVGACLSEPIAGHINWTGFNSAEHIVFNHLARLPEKTVEEIASFDLQIVQIPLRSVMPEGGYVRLDYHDLAAYQAFFAWSLEQLERMFEAGMRYNAEHGLLTFVHNFLTPQQNPMGRLFPKYDLRNPVFFVDQLNRRLGELIARRNNTYLLDVDEIAATHGKRFFQDDGVWAFSHGSIVDHYDHPYDRDRIEPPAPIYDLYEVRNHEYRAAVWHEVVSMVETLRQIDTVKMVVIDLDDTLWRTELAEKGGVADHLIEGWPLGFIETLLYMKRRGIALGVISRNDEATIEALWDDAVARLLKLDDFAIRRINWRPKPENMREILETTNLLPSNVVYIDDHPIQRAAMAEAFPEIRVLGRDPYYLRRILLWSPETQSSGVTPESARRTEMLQAQAQREGERRASSPETFLAGLGLRLSLGVLTRDHDPDFERCLELLNKTNQFNTTGQRWTPTDFQNFLDDGGLVVHARAEDRFTAYGLIWVSLIRGRCVEQAVMSCRVAGLEVETAALAVICDMLATAGDGPVLGILRETEKNLLCRDLFRQSGFELQPDGVTWLRRAGGTLRPAHIRFDVTPLRRPAKA